MQSKYYAVLDTNVLVSALLGATRMSTPTRVLKAVTENKLIVLYNKSSKNTEPSFPERNFHLAPH